MQKAKNKLRYKYKSYLCSFNNSFLHLKLLSGDCFNDNNSIKLLNNYNKEVESDDDDVNYLMKQDEICIDKNPLYYMPMCIECEVLGCGICSLIYPPETVQLKF